MFSKIRHSLASSSVYQFTRQCSSLPRYSPSHLLPPGNFGVLSSNGSLNEALLEMASQGLHVRFADYDSILNECVHRKAIREGQRVHTHMIKTRYLPPVYLRTRLVILYCKCGWLADAREVFDEMPEWNVVSWTAMISGYSQHGYSLAALDLFAQMLRSGTEPNEFTFATVLTSCTGENGLDLGRQIHSLSIKSNHDSHIFVGSSLLDMYAKSGRIQEAHTVFKGLPDRDVVSCTAIISGYAQLGLDAEAVGLFRSLQREGMVSNYVTYASVLTALSGLAALRHGKQVHGHVLRRRVPSFVVLQNSLIDMYAKCGNLNYARSVFDTMSEKSVISWNTMLVGYGKHGMGAQVVDLFEAMRDENKVVPDSVTFLAVLSGCSHAQMGYKGLRYFDELVSRKYGIEPNIEHYGCVVDLLGRAGKLEKALKFIEEMPLEPTAAIWGSLLGACRVHSNVRVGEIVGQKLMETEPENAGNYVILSNLYASSGRWEEVRMLRGMMDEKAIRKEPGRSWIDLDQTLHTFHASDRSHPMKDEIHAKVKEVMIKIKEVGYEPDLSCVLHDVDAEQKEKILLGHSEKLALSFGLMSTRNGSSIVVIKNLRICVDCHNFAKFVSRIYGREVSLRDKNRFHHIVGGICSCGDYW